ncbi:hypothetical protein RIF29_07541 [Crotalaria pallida]|uniref:Uncharacterized protein n=1 Tax=Crotalaria pallida TaxID=3830 RepID=A0AAN9PAV7_CROPI
MHKAIVKETKATKKANKVHKSNDIHIFTHEHDNIRIINNNAVVVICSILILYLLTIPILILGARMT